MSSIPQAPCSRGTTSDRLLPVLALSPLSVLAALIPSITSTFSEAIVQGGAQRNRPTSLSGLPETRRQPARLQPRQRLRDNFGARQRLQTVLHEKPAAGRIARYQPVNGHAFIYVSPFKPSRDRRRQTHRQVETEQEDGN